MLDTCWSGHKLQNRDKRLSFIFIIYFVDLFSALFRGKLISIPFLGGAKSTSVSEDLQSSRKSISKNKLSEEDEFELQSNQKYKDNERTLQRNEEKSTEKFSKGSDPSEFVIKILDGIIDDNKDIWIVWMEVTICLCKA